VDRVTLYFSSLSPVPYQVGQAHGKSFHRPFSIVLIFMRQNANTKFLKRSLAHVRSGEGGVWAFPCPIYVRFAVVG